MIDVTGSRPVEYRGEVPPRSVVIPGSRSKGFPAGSFGLPCGLIIGYRDEDTDDKVRLNELLRDHGVSMG